MLTNSIIHLVRFVQRVLPSLIKFVAVLILGLVAAILVILDCSHFL